MSLHFPFYIPVTDIEIIDTPQRNEVEVYRLFYHLTPEGRTESDGKYNCYKNPTAASLARLARLVPAPDPAQPLIRSEDEDGWRREKTWAWAPVQYRKEWHPLRRKTYIDLQFRLNYLIQAPEGA